jgi:ferredoxin/flavodoxin---NADP+ reductase
MSGFANARLCMRREWAPGLLSLQLAADVEPFTPGQFRNLALYREGQLERRAYSMASAPGEPLEFFLNRVSGGRFSPALAELQDGDELLVEKKAQGFFTLDFVPPAEEIWFVATGTGLAPFISMLRSEQPWQRFRRIVVVHGVRESAQLAYRDELIDRSRAHGHKLVWIPVVSREPNAPGVLHGRMTTALTSGELERYAGLALSPERSHLMLCGNPEMIKELSALLEARGLRKHRVRRPGHVSTEQYW